MAIDLKKEKPISLAAAGRLPYWGKDRGVNPSTTWRWYRKGVNGVKLETIVVGGTRMTTEPACLRFIERTTAAANGEQTTTSMSKRRQREIEAAEKELAKMGA